MLAVKLLLPHLILLKTTSACFKNGRKDSDGKEECRFPNPCFWLHKPAGDEPRGDKFSTPNKSFNWDALNKEAFAKADKDGNGCVDWDELQWFEASIPTDPNSDVYPGGWIDIDEFGKSAGNDGCATWEEAENGLKKQLEKQGEGPQAGVDGLRSLNENKNENELKLMKWVNG